MNYSVCTLFYIYRFTQTWRFNVLASKRYNVCWSWQYFAVLGYFSHDVPEEPIVWYPQHTSAI